MPNRRAWRRGAAQILWLGSALLHAQGGPTDRQPIDEAAARRGRLLYAERCINCHGSNVKGTDEGPDLIRSVIVLHDRFGDEIGPAIRPSAAHEATLTEAQIVDLSHFLHERIEATAVNRTPTQPIDVLTGNVEAGRAYFNGAGRCAACHSPAGDLAGIGRRNPLAIQQTFLFPRLTAGRERQVEVTVTPRTGPAVSGALVRIDDFNVSLRDASGDYRAFARTPELSVEVRDPLAAHHALLDEYTDQHMHDVVAYLETLK